jgi:hypothetical protein
MIMTGPKFHSKGHRTAITIIGTIAMRMSAGIKRTVESITAIIGVEPAHVDAS